MLGPDTIIEEEKRLAALVSQAFLANDSVVSLQETVEIQPTDQNVRVDLEEISKSLENHAKRRKVGPKIQMESVRDGEKERRKRKKQESNNSSTSGKSPPPLISQQKVEDVCVTEKNRFIGNSIDDHESQADRKRRKEEKKKLKKLEEDSDKTHSNSENQTKLEEIGSTNTAPEPLGELKKRKKKRRHADTDHESRADRKRRKEEKKRHIKLEKDAADKTHSNPGNQTKPEAIGSAIAAPELLDEPKKRKKKRKHVDVE